MAMTYAQLTQALQDYTENTESSFISHIPNFVIVSEQRIYNAVQALAVRKNSLGTTVTSNPYLAVPTDWLATFSISVIDSSGQHHFLLNKEPDFIQEAYPPATTPNAMPKHYASYDVGTFLLGPTPDQNYSVELNYYGYPPSLSTLGPTGTNWLSTNFESVLLYGSLVEAYTYMKGEPELIKQYETQFTNLLAELKVLVDGKVRRDSYRSGQTRVQVP
jgi:hypothetical protein